MKKSNKFEWSKIDVPAVVSLLTSLIEYIIAPHITWHIDKEKLQFEN